MKLPGVDEYTAATTSGDAWLPKEGMRGARVSRRVSRRVSTRHARVFPTRAVRAETRMNARADAALAGDKIARPTVQSRHRTVAYRSFQSRLRKYFAQLGKESSTRAFESACATSCRKVREIQNGGDLFSRKASVQLHQFINCYAVFQVFEYRRNGHTRVSEDPCAAYLSGDALHGRTLRPVEPRCAAGVIGAGNGQVYRACEQIRRVLLDLLTPGSSLTREFRLNFGHDVNSDCYGRLLEPPCRFRATESSREFKPSSAQSATG